MNLNVSEGAGQKLHYKLQRRETLQRREKGANICWDAVHIMIWRGGLLSLWSTTFNFVILKMIANDKRIKYNIQSNKRGAELIDLLTIIN